MVILPMQESSKATKETIARAYESRHFNETLDEVLHPGGLELTARVAEVAEISSESSVLDISSGRGTTSCFLAQQFGCYVTGVDISLLSTSLASHKADVQNLSPLIDFLAADAEYLPFEDSSFDVIVSECSFSLQLDKQRGASEITRVMKPGGKFVLTDVMLKSNLSQELKTDLTFSCCFSGAETQDGYLKLFTDAGLKVICFEDHSKSMKKITYQVITGYGSLSAFWEQFGSKSSPCCPVEGTTTGSRKLWLRMFQEGKPGYGLLAFTKPLLNT